MSLLLPIIIILKGQLLLAWIVSLFSIVNTLAVKMNDYVVTNYTISEVYKAGVVVHFLLTISASIFFISPLAMIWMDSTLVIIETAVFSSYSVILNNYLTEHFPKNMSSFQIIRNSSWADGALWGLGTITVVTFFLPLSYAVGIFVVANFIFGLWLLKNWNFYDNV